MHPSPHPGCRPVDSTRFTATFRTSAPAGIASAGWPAPAPIPVEHALARPSNRDAPFRVSNRMQPPSRSTLRSNVDASQPGPGDTPVHHATAIPADAHICVPVGLRTRAFVERIRTTQFVQAGAPLLPVAGVHDDRGLDRPALRGRCPGKVSWSVESQRALVCVQVVDLADVAG